ncbi:sulfite exporter TauE/SafE family protein [Pedosphaera parvula]|uniref:Probable membrane transporter protein n=1 Tax=Pedosphaera parvula (strain Ellin514) TaxID=320771 RepID=B9XAB7_PEDPL|nr:sulfite exporter TauE/SafE family protein [Pedosphaera parvula]EEF63458.1 protein of unknown function DUF81 [Pedosphaera parvula Ellin514]
MAVALILGVAIGLALGLLGGGGSIITVPVLVYAANVPAQSAVAMSLAIVGVTSIAGACMKWRQGLVHARASVLFSLTGIIGALAGGQLTPLVRPSVLLVIFAGLMLVIAGRMLWARKQEDVPAAAQCRPWRCASAGMGVGIMTGFLGVGGGFLIVPALMHFGRIPLKQAVGTSLVIIALNSLAGLVGHLGHGSVDWRLTGIFSLLALIGMFAGVQLSRKVSKEKLSRWFAWVVIAVAIFVLIRNRKVFSEPW